MDNIEKIKAGVASMKNVIGAVRKLSRDPMVSQALLYDAETAYAALEAAATLTQPMAEGWKMVPVEPTEAMLAAARKTEWWPNYEGGNMEPPVLRHLFSVMAAAAPASPIAESRTSTLDAAIEAISRVKAFGKTDTIERDAINIHTIGLCIKAIEALK